MRPESLRSRLRAGVRRVALLSAAALLLQSAMSLAAADTIRQYQIKADGTGGYRLALEAVQQPEAGPGEVLVRVHAVSLNRRDTLMLAGRYGPRGSLGSHSASKAAGWVRSAYAPSR